MHHAQRPDRLGEQQFHRAAIDFAGERAAGPADRPEAENDLHQRMDVADRERVHRPLEVYALAADDASARACPARRRSRPRWLSASAGAVGKRAEEGGDLRHHSLRDLAPTGTGSRRAAARRRRAASAGRGAVCSTRAIMHSGSVDNAHRCRPSRAARCADRPRPGSPSHSSSGAAGRDVVSEFSGAVGRQQLPGRAVRASSSGNPAKLHAHERRLLQLGQWSAGARACRAAGCRRGRRPLDLGEDVRGEERPSARGSRRLAELAEQFVAHRRVERVGRLVENEQRHARREHRQAARPCASCRTRVARAAATGRCRIAGPGASTSPSTACRATRRGSGRVAGRSCSRRVATRRAGRRPAGGRRRCRASNRGRRSRRGRRSAAGSRAAGEWRSICPEPLGPSRPKISPASDAQGRAHRAPESAIILGQRRRSGAAARLRHHVRSLPDRGRPRTITDDRHVAPFAQNTSG